MTSATARGHVFLDRRLFLPEAWCWDGARRAEARVPEEVTFQTKPEQARAMLEHAWEQGVPMRWVTGDSVYGDAPNLRAAIEAHGCWYVLAITSLVRCWLNLPPLEFPQAQTGGRPRRAVRLAQSAPKARTVAEVIARLPREQWKRLSVGAGAKGPRIYDWARVRVIESRDGFPGPAVWLLARGSVSDPTKLTHSFALAPSGFRSSSWPRWQAPATPWSSVSRRAKGKPALINTPSGIGRVGIGTSPCLCWLMPGSPTSTPARGKKAGLEDLTVPEVRRLLEVALPLASADSARTLGLVHLAPPQGLSRTDMPLPALLLAQVCGRESA